MHIICLDDETVATGRHVFKMYIARAACGPGSHAYEFGRLRATGAHGVVGCIMECINLGLTNEDDIVHAVARATHCRTSTIEAFLDFLKGDDPTKHLWQMADGHYRCLETSSTCGDRTQILLTA